MNVEVRDGLKRKLYPGVLAAEQKLLLAQNVKVRNL
jgi:hypothetical protein